MSIYRRDLAIVHHRGFGAQADACAPGILGALDGVRARGGLVHEVGCGSGLLTRHLVSAGHRVLATDASTAMLDVARQSWEGGDVEFRRVVLPDDPLPLADAVVSVGHALNYLPDADAIDRALLAIAASLRPGGVLAIDLCDLEYGDARRGAPTYSRVTDDWALVARFSSPAPDRFVRDITTFVRDAGGGWRRDDERHENVLVDTSIVGARLATAGVDATIRPSFGAESLPPGLRALVGRKR